MTNQELLNWAETMFGEGDNAKSREQGMSAYTQSIAASLLVIARNSMPEIVNIMLPSQIPDEADPNLFAGKL
jgi:hypothetical protein